MSERFSFTTITSAATMLNAATATTSSRIRLIMVFSMRMARKYAACSCGPVAHRVAPPPTAAATARGARRRAHHVVEPEPQAGRQRSAAAECRGVLEGDQRQAAVVLLQPDLEHAGDRERLQPRPSARAQQFAARHHHRDLVADVRAELPGDHPAEDDASLARLEVGERALHQVPLDVGHLRPRAADRGRAAAPAAGARPGRSSPARRRTAPRPPCRARRAPRPPSACQSCIRPPRVPRAWRAP